MKRLLVHLRSLRWRLAASYLALALLTVALTGALTLVLVRYYARQREADYLRARAEVVAREAVPLLTPTLQIDALSALATNTGALDDVQVKITGPQGEVLADSGPPTGQVLLLAARTGNANEVLAVRLVDEPPGTAQASTVVVSGTWPISLTAVPTQWVPAITPRSAQVARLPIGDAAAPFGLVEVSNGPDFTTSALGTARQSLFYAALAATGVALLVGLLVGQRLSAPLRELAEAAAKMETGNMAVRAPVHGQDEVGQLAGQFNHMAARLQASFDELAGERDALRRFIADASHELRTPITALKTFNELLQGAAAEDPQAQADFLAESQAQLERLEWIVQNLLDLSRLEAGLAALELAPCDAGEMMASALGAVRRRAEERGISLELHRPAVPFSVQCDRMRVEMALGNLLDNALKFTPGGGTVQLGVEPLGHSARFWVRDSGPGIRAEELPHLFERFYRGSDHRVPGSGLGLAIVKGIALAHGGRVGVESELEKGSCFTLELPL